MDCSFHPRSPQTRSLLTQQPTESRLCVAQSASLPVWTQTHRAVPLTRRLQNIHHRGLRPVAAWSEDIPRIVEFIPRRVPRVDMSRIWDFSAHEFTDFLNPGGVPDLQRDFWTFIILGAFLFAVGAEAWYLGNKALQALKGTGTAEKQAPADSRLPSSGAPGPPSMQLAQQRQEYHKQVMEERWRGLRWLAVVAVLAVWSAGICNVKDLPTDP